MYFEYNAKAYKHQWRIKEDEDLNKQDLINIKTRIFRERMFVDESLEGTGMMLTRGYFRDEIE